MFRDAAGQPLEGCLTFYLDDVEFNDTAPVEGLFHLPISITFTTLNMFLNKAERVGRKDKVQEPYPPKPIWDPDGDHKALPIPDEQDIDDHDDSDDDKHHGRPRKKAQGRRR